jgi:hypothetical protein
MIKQYPPSKFKTVSMNDPEFSVIENWTVLNRASIRFNGPNSSTLHALVMKRIESGEIELLATYEPVKLGDAAWKS